MGSRSLNIWLAAIALNFFLGEIPDEKSGVKFPTKKK
jgi:hypothetical protein